MSSTRTVPFSQETPLVRRWARRFIGTIGSLIRVQWFVRNVAPVSAGDLDASMPAGVTVRAGSSDDAVALAPLIHGRESLAWRCARGDLVLVAELDGEVVGCTWLTRRPMRPSYFPVMVRPAPGEWYNYGLALLRQHRAHGLGRVLSRAAMREAGRRGGAVVFGHASRFNRVAAASHVAAGFVTVEDLISLTMLNRFAVVVVRRPRVVQMDAVEVSRRAGDPGPLSLRARRSGSLRG